MKQQIEETNDYQTDIYEAKVKIAIVKWKSGTRHKHSTHDVEIPRKKC
jgi:hypothetical protein